MSECIDEIHELYPNVGDVDIEKIVGKLEGFFTRHHVGVLRDGVRIPVRTYICEDIDCLGSYMEEKLDEEDTNYLIGLYRDEVMDFVMNGVNLPSCTYRFVKV